MPLLPRRPVRGQPRRTGVGDHQHRPEDKPMKFRAAILGLLLSSVAFATSPIHWPVTPPPVPPPSPVTTLATDQLYVIGLDQPAVVVASPDGIVKVTTEAGPVKISGNFVDGDGKRKTRTFASKQVVTVEPVAAGQVELIVTWGDPAA